jgi:hypothetical protein
MKSSENDQELFEKNIGIYKVRELNNLHILSSMTDRSEKDKHELLLKPIQLTRLDTISDQK